MVNTTKFIRMMDTTRLMRMGANLITIGRRMRLIRTMRMMKMMGIMNMSNTMKLLRAMRMTKM